MLFRSLRVLSNLLGLPGFEQETVEEVRAEALGDAALIAARLDNTTRVTIGVPALGTPGYERIADVPLYATDAIVRRAACLQATADAAAPVVGVPSVLWQQLGLAPGARVTVKQGAASATLPAREDATLAPNAVRIAAGHPSTATLGAMFGALTVEAAKGAAR